MKARIAALAAAGAVMLAAAGPARAATTTFGANLEQAPTNTATCGNLGGPSCTFFSGASGPSFYAPQSGTVTAVHVRVGPVTGPMQVVVMRSLYQNKAGDPGHPYFACCFVERYGPVFTPAAGAISTVAANLPMTEEPVPPPEDTTTNAAGDFLALSVLSPEVPIPLIAGSGASYVGYVPALTEANTPAPSPTPSTASTDGFGGIVAMSADLETGGGTTGGGTTGGGTIPPVAGPAPAPAPPLATPALPRLTLPASIPLRGGTAAVPVQCLLAGCSGLITLQSQRPAGAAALAAKASRPISYGTAKFALQAGKKGVVRIKLNKAGLALFKQGRHSVKLWAIVTFTAGGGRPSSQRITLRRR